MAVKMYKEGNSIKVRGCNVQTQLDAGWTFEPAVKSTVKKLPKYKLEVKKVDVITTDLNGPEDLTTNKE